MTTRSPFLDDEDLKQLTGRERRAAQVKQLNAMGIEHRQRADRSIVVMWATVERQLGAATPARQKAPREFTITQPGAR